MLHFLYGFMARDSGGQRCVRPVSALDRSGISTLDEGQAVDVDVVEGRKGLEAAKVRLV
jgi:cold shock protein